MRENDYVTADSLFRQRFPDGNVPISRRPIIARIRQDTALMASVFAEARRAPSLAALEGAKWIAVYFGDTPTADALARTVAESAASRSIHSAAWQLRAEIALAEGRWDDVEHALTRYAERGGAQPSLYRALFATMPFMSLDSARLEDFRTALLEETAATRVADPSAENPAVSWYLMGLLNSSLGYYAAALENAAEIERTRADPLIPLTHGLAATVRADVALRSGDAARALTILSGIQPIIPLPQLSSPFVAQEHARFLQVDALTALGRHEQALTCLNACFSGTPSELAYLAPVHLRRARTLEHLGRPDEAAQEYVWVELLWRGADEPMRSFAAEARDRIRAAGSER